jgi:hypothetical protein
MAIEQLSNDDLMAIIGEGAPPGVASPSIGPDEFEVEGKRLEGVQQEAIEREAIINPSPTQQEPGLKDVAIAPAGFIVGDIRDTIQGLASGDPTAAIASTIAAVPGIPKEFAQGLADGLSAMFLAARRVNTPEDLKRIEDLASKGEFKRLREEFASSVDKSGNILTEISDVKATLSPRKIKTAEKTKLSLNRVLDHPTLFDAVPELRNTDIRVNPNSSVSGFRPSKGRPLITIGKKSTRAKLDADGKPLPEFEDKTDIELMGSVLHEVMHDVQGIDVLESGISPSTLQSLGFNEAESRELYFSVIGEAQARDVSRRFVEGVDVKTGRAPAVSRERRGEAPEQAAITDENLPPIAFDELQSGERFKKKGATKAGRQAAEVLSKRKPVGAVKQK